MTKVHVTRNPKTNFPELQVTGKSKKIIFSAHIQQSYFHHCLAVQRPLSRTEAQDIAQGIIDLLRLEQEGKR